MLQVSLVDYWMTMRLIQGKKKGAHAPFFESWSILTRLLFVTVALTEFVDLLGGLQDVLLTGVKRMGLA